MDKISIRIVIAGKKYPMTVNAKDEERIREAAKLVEKMLDKQRELLGNIDTQELLGIVAFYLMIENLELKEEQAMFIKEKKSISLVIGEIENTLKEKK